MNYIPHAQPWAANIFGNLHPWNDPLTSLKLSCSLWVQSASGHPQRPPFILVADNILLFKPCLNFSLMHFCFLHLMWFFIASFFSNCSSSARPTYPYHFFPFTTGPRLQSTCPRAHRCSTWCFSSGFPYWSRENIRTQDKPDQPTLSGVSHGDLVQSS